MGVYRHPWRRSRLQHRRAWVGTAAYAPSNVTPPTISGSAVVGQTLTATPGTWLGSPTSFTYQWRRDNLGGGNFADINGATSSTYTLVDADDGSQIRCRVTAQNPTGASAPAVSNTLGPVIQPDPVNTVLPNVSGTLVVGSALVCSTGSWTHMGGYNARFLYQWQRDNHGDNTYTSIGGATSAVYTLTDADDQCNLRCQVTARNTGTG